MDFRSQLSAFKSGGGNDRNSSSNSSNGDGRRNPNYSSRSNQRGYGNTNNSGSAANYYSRGEERGHSSRDNSHHRDNYRRDNNYQNNNKRRHRPHWGNDSHGPPHASRRRYHSPDRDGLGDLRQFGYQILKGNPVAPSAEEKAKKTKHIALLAIIIDDLPYEHIWKAWIDTLNSSAQDDYFVSLVCHAKFPEKVQSQWLKDRLLLRRPKLGRGNSYLDPEFLSRKPEWGSVEITRAMLDLLQEAAKIGQDDQKDARFSSNRYVVRTPKETVDTTVPPSPAATAASSTLLPTVDQFLFLSETCLPVRTALETFGVVPGPTVSWINGRHRKDPNTPKNKYEDDQFALISRRIPGQFRWKADQWVLLGRLHVTAILAMDRPHFHPRHQMWQHFRNINASDEMYIPTAMALLGYLRYTAEGEDTQRARNAMSADIAKNAANSPKISSPKNDSSSGTIPRKEEEKSDTITAVPSPPPPPEMVLKRPVTYTDWTEGMRNPACFTRGITDFTRVAQLARKKGCLVARKFAPKVAMPNSSTEKNQTDIAQEKGYITAEEWLVAVTKWAQEDEAKGKAEQSKKDVVQESKPQVEADEEGAKEGAKEGAEAEAPDLEPSAETKSNDTFNNDNEDDYEDDDDEEETELE